MARTLGRPEALVSHGGAFPCHVAGVAAWSGVHGKLGWPGRRGGTPVRAAAVPWADRGRLARGMPYSVTLRGAQDEPGSPAASAYLAILLGRPAGRPLLSSGRACRQQGALMAPTSYLAFLPWRPAGRHHVLAVVDGGGAELCAVASFAEAPPAGMLADALNGVLSRQSPPNSVWTRRWMAPPCRCGRRSPAWCPPWSPRTTRRPFAWPGTCA